MQGIFKKDIRFFKNINNREFSVGHPIVGKILIDISLMVFIYSNNILNDVLAFSVNFLAKISLHRIIVFSTLVRGFF